MKRKRIAAIESRNRKKEKFRQLENNLEWLKTENTKLQKENDLLRKYLNWAIFERVSSRVF